MRIIPVIDLAAKTVVHAVAGRRNQYRPIESKLCESTSPIDIAQAFRSRFGLTELYLADLDAIQGKSQTPDWSTIGPPDRKRLQSLARCRARGPRCE